MCKCKYEKQKLKKTNARINEKKKAIPYSRPKPSDFYTLSQRKLLENHTRHKPI